MTFAPNMKWRWTAVFYELPGWQTLLDNVFEFVHMNLLYWIELIGIEGTSKTKRCRTLWVLPASLSALSRGAGIRTETGENMCSLSDHCDLCSFDKVRINDRTYADPSVSRSVRVVLQLFTWILRTVRGPGRTGWTTGRTKTVRIGSSQSSYLSNCTYKLWQSVHLW